MGNPRARFAAFAPPLLLLALALALLPAPCRAKLPACRGVEAANSVLHHICASGIAADPLRHSLFVAQGRDCPSATHGSRVVKLQLDRDLRTVAKELPLARETAALKRAMGAAGADAGSDAMDPDLYDVVFSSGSVGGAGAELPRIMRFVS